MQKPTQTKQSEQLNIQENVENNHNKQSSLIEREKIEGTPFTLITLNEEYFMVMGDYKVTETTKTKEEQIQKLESEKWLLIMHICIVALERMKKVTDEFEKDKEKDIKYTNERNVPVTEHP